MDGQDTRPAEPPDPPGDGWVARTPEPARIDDARTLRALSHPRRHQLLELLAREGPLTATRAGELLDDSPGNMSWHLQTLARAGLIEEAEPGAAGRSRPWRLVSLGYSFESGGDDPETSVAAEVLERLAYARAFAAQQEWVATRHASDPQWRAAGFANLDMTYLTVDELQELEADIRAVIRRHRDRLLDPARRPPDARAIQLMAFGHPLPPIAGGS